MITEATLEDVPALCGLLGELFTQESDFRPDDTRQTAGLRLILENPAFGRIFVAREKGMVAAMVNLLFLISPGGPSILLEDLIVLRSFRGKGLATSLLRHTLDFARAAGARHITLLTDSTNHRAIRLYQKAGYLRAEGSPVRKWLAARDGEKP